MNYIVFDMEWNQPFSKETAIQSPIYFSGEIIQIGAIKLNEQGKAIDCFNMLIAPTFYKRLHFRIKKITGIDQKMLKDQKRFKDAINDFREWCGKNCLLLSWGYDDIQMLRDNLLMHDLDENWLPPCLNLQGIYNRQIAKENRQFSLETAMETLGITSTLPAHDAFNDAIYTARVAGKLDLLEGVRNYQELNGILWYSMHSLKEVFKPARTIEKAFADPRLKKVTCPICKEVFTIREYTPTDERSAEAEIPTRHGTLSIKLKAMRNQKKQWQVRRTIRFV